MRNFPNVYLSYCPGMPPVNGTPGSFVDMLKKCLVTGGDPVSYTAINVVNGVATINVLVDNQVFFNGCRITITGCDEPVLNDSHVVDSHTKRSFSFLTGAADGSYGGSIKASLNPAGWELVFTGTNEAVFRSSNPDVLPVCIKVIDTTSTYALFEFYEDMSSINVGVNKADPSVFYAGWRPMIIKSRSANATPMHWWLVADNTTVHVNVGFTSNSVTAEFENFRGTVPVSFGSYETFNIGFKKNFFWVGPYNTTPNDYWMDTAYSTVGVSSNRSATAISNMVGLTLGKVNPGIWERYAPMPAIPFIGSGRASGSSISSIGYGTGTDRRIHPTVLVGPYFNIRGSNSNGIEMMGIMKDSVYLIQNIAATLRNCQSLTINDKKYISLPLFSYNYGAGGGGDFTGIYWGSCPMLYSEKWGD